MLFEARGTVRGVEEFQMLEIVWRNPRELTPKSLKVSRLVSCDVSDFELWSLYRSISNEDEAEVFYELLVYVSSDPICAA